LQNATIAGRRDMTPLHAPGAVLAEDEGKCLTKVSTAPLVAA
jgi:hypothetical protein